jgi:alpha-ketoglutarate-dependent taurine dioxygenase
MTGPTELGAVPLRHVYDTATSGADVDGIRRHLGESGFVYVDGVPDGFDHVELLGQLGRFVPQYDGREVWDLVAEPGMDDVYHSRNRRALVPHTEAYEYPGLPPRYLALWCVRPAGGTGGETTLADGWQWLASLDDSVLQALRARRYRWHSSEGLARQGVRVESVHPVLASVGGETVLRYSYNNVVADDLLRGVLESGKAFFDREHTAVRIERNALLIWDNWRMLHSRTAFDDPRRHLRRVLVAA